MNKNGFTLLEIVIVIVIVGIIVGIGIARYTGTSEKTIINEGIRAVKAIADAQMVRRAEKGNFTNNINDLDIEFDNLKHFSNPSAGNGVTTIASITRDTTGGYILDITPDGALNCTPGESDLDGLNSACEHAQNLTKPIIGLPSDDFACPPHCPGD